MPLIDHIFQLILFSVICFGPATLSLFLTMAGQKSELEGLTASRLLSFLTIWTGIQICIALLAGMTGHFDLGTVFWIELIILVAGLLLLRGLRRYSTSPSLLMLGRQLTATPVQTLTFYISCLGIILCLQLAVQPIIDADSLWYHLPVMARWYQDFAFTKLPEFTRFTSFDWIAEQVGYYPYSWEAFCTLFILPFKEDFLVALPNLIAWLVLGLSTYLLGLEFGASHFYALATSVLLLVIPINLQQINTLHIDLPLAAFFASSAFFAVAYQRNYSLHNLCLSLLSISILVGIKTSALAYAALTILLLLLSRLKLFLRNQGESGAKFNKRQIFLLTIVLVPILFMSGFWYIRNFIEVGNPLGNFSVKLFGMTILPGPLDSSKIRGTTLAVLFHPFSWESWKVLLTQAGGRIQLPFAIFAGLNLLLIPYFRRVATGLDRQRGLSMFILLIGSGFLYWNTPYGAAIGDPPWTLTAQVFGQALRYSLPFVGMLSVTAAVVSTAIEIDKKYAAIVVWLCCILGLANTLIYDIIRTQGTFKVNVGGGSVLMANLIESFKQNPWDAIVTLAHTMGDILVKPLLFMVIYFVITLLSKPLILASSKILSLVNYQLQSIQARKVPLQIIVATLVIVLMTYGIREQHSMDRASTYGETYQYVSERLKAGEKIGYAVSNRSYLLYGKNLDRKVIYLGSKSTKITEYLAKIQKLNISFVAIGPFIDGNFSSAKEASWIAKNPNSFTPLFKLDPNFSQGLYKISAPPSAPRAEGVTKVR
jgi:hypothetical protein